MCVSSGVFEMSTMEQLPAQTIQPNADHHGYINIYT